MPSSKDVSTAGNTIGDRLCGGCLSKGVLENLLRFPEEEDGFLADDFVFLDSFTLKNCVGKNKLSGVFSQGGDQVVVVPIEEGVFLERELSSPNTASGVGRIAYGEGVAMSSGLYGFGVTNRGSCWLSVAKLLLGPVGVVPTLRGLTPTPGFIVSHPLGGRAGGVVPGPRGLTPTPIK